ncbi:TPA: polysaccharide pyruvyl transferase family protein [Candidatus Berkelbacteria bacterium]|uniref:Polysaccharide pyruvyl transferase n=1 Tax=Berkelbacteria bacterium GW2011_GWE1_39_12 TaxID=1618337 RepID=A0A0G4B605_9BACT|nr:MAG: Polysaccharide pyruvyl transferase [Berkelbacteria bacterium GW2011_GWE1_39_12]HBO61039.1 polysaccharide pyruvyl transferase family protein [Candidatus Berkelbacteria bacterium]
MKQPKIGIVGYFGHENAGDEIMKDLMLAEFPNSVAMNLGKLEKCDAYIIAGGDLITKYHGLHLPEIWNSVTDEPCYALSLGVKPGWEVLQDQVINHLKKFRIVYVRDQKSFDVLSKYSTLDGVMPDLVFLADAAKATENYPILFNYTDRPELNPNGQFEDVLNSGEVFPIALSPDFDTNYSKKIVDAKKFISMAKSSKGVIGTRLHSVVMAVIADVPVVAITYEEKVRKFCERYDIPCFEYGQKNGKEILESMKKTNIDLESERTKIRTVINMIKEDLLSREWN